MRRQQQRVFDTLECRDLMSITPMLSAIHYQPVTAAALNGVAVPPLTSFDGGIGITTDPSTPRANEVSRRAFRASFSGRVVELLPRLDDQARQFYILAPGGTNQFLHGTLQMRYYTPSSVAVAPFNQLTGTFSIADRNTASNGLILADMSGDPTHVDARGRPTQLNFTVNGGGGSGGIYASSVGNGTVTIHYHGNAAKVVVLGSIFINGIGQNLDVFQYNQRG